MKRMILTTCVLTAMLFAGCGDDEAVGSQTGGTGGKPSGGTGGGGTGGHTGGSGGTDASSTGATGGSAGNPADAAGPSRLLVAGSDFSSQTEIATIDLGSGTRLGTVTVPDGDAVPAASGALGFVLERTLAKVDVLDATGAIGKTIDVGAIAVGETGTQSTNPVSVAVVSNKAYVVLGGANKLAVIDLGTGTLSKAIDLSAYQAAGDQDGAVDAVGAVVDSNRVYFVLGRVDITTVKAPSYELACPSVKALVLAVDTGTEQLADLNGSASGEGFELGLVNPVDVALESGNLVVLSAGCFAPADGGSTRVSAGIEAVNLTSGAVSIRYQSPNQDYLARFILRGTNEKPLLDAFDATFAEHWYELDSSGGLNELSGVPAAPSLENAANLLGVKISTSDAGSSADVVRYAIGTQQSTNVASSVWTGNFSNAAGTAVVQ